MSPIIYSSKELRERHPTDFYPTPLEFCRAALDLIPVSRTAALVLDPGAGKGPWGQALKEINPDSYIWGVEIEPEMKPPWYDSWSHGDFLEQVGYGVNFDLVIGNPPYRYAEKFIRKSFEMLGKDGHILFLLRLAFLESQERYFGLWKDHKPLKVWTCARRPSFTGDGKTDSTAYAVYLWSKEKFEGDTIMDWMYWELDNGQNNRTTNKKPEHIGD